MKHMGSAEKKQKSRASLAKRPKPAYYGVCINNTDYPASLETRKIYRLLPDQAAGKHRLVRVIDESGEDYLYPQEYFVPIKLPRAVEPVTSLIF
jgi:hypothetical protein